MFDYLSLETELTDQERQFRDAARSFLEEKIRPHITEYFLDETFPEELIPAMGDHDFFAPTIDEYGLPGVSERAYGLLMQELGACDAGIRSMASVQGTLVMYPIYTYGSDKQKDEWLPGLATGSKVGGFALTEPEHGSDPSRMESVARMEGDEYVLEGKKRWCTNSPIANVLVVWARDLSADDAPVRGFLVETWRDGLDINEISEKLSLRVSISGEFTMDRVRIPEENVLPGVEGMKGPLSCLTQARYGIAWSAVGVARDCFETALEYAQERNQFGKPIAGFQLQQSKLAEMATEITTSQLLAHRLSELKQRGELRPQQVSMAKRNNVAMAREQARVAREILGGEGITSEHPPMRHLANMESVYTYEGTHDIHTLILGEDLTGISAFE